MSPGPVPFTLTKSGAAVDAGIISSTDQQPWVQRSTRAFAAGAVDRGSKVRPAKRRSFAPTAKMSVTRKPSWPAGGATSTQEPAGPAGSAQPWPCPPVPVAPPTPTTPPPVPAPPMMPPPPPAPPRPTEGTPPPPPRPALPLPGPAGELFELHPPAPIVMAPYATVNVSTSEPNRERSIPTTALHDEHAVHEAPVNSEGGKTRSSRTEAGIDPEVGRRRQRGRGRAGGSVSRKACTS